VRIAQVQPGDIENQFQFSRTQIRRTGKTEMTLDSISRDVMARISSVEATDAHGLRLMEMGLVPGAQIRVVKAAPLGDPIQVCIHNYHLALRRTEARSIQVTVED
jgi:ferrous iron transport protein A